MMRTNPQILKRIWAAAREARVEEEQLRDLVGQVTAGATRSTATLTYKQAGDLVDALVRLGASPRINQPVKTPKPSGRRTPEGVDLLLTGAQRKGIAELREQIGGKMLSDEYFEGFCKKAFGKTRPATAGEGATIIQALIIRSRWRPGKGKRREDG
jgi:hypothetical protein